VVVLSLVTWNPMQPEPRPSGAGAHTQFLPLRSQRPEGAGDTAMYASTECKAEVTPSQHGNRTFSYTLEDHTKQAFGIMNELRLSQQLCDVTLQVKYQDAPAAQFMAHKVVLASSSPVFKAMFTNGLREQGMEVVSIEGIHPKVMERLIEFAYTASISMGEKCVLHVMNGAVMYQIDSVVRACSDFLVQQLDPSNAIGIANFAEQIGCTELHQHAREYIYMHFGEVSEGWGHGTRASEQPWEDRETDRWVITVSPREVKGQGKEMEKNRVELPVYISVTNLGNS